MALSNMVCPTCLKKRPGSHPSHPHAPPKEQTAPYRGGEADLQQHLAFSHRGSLLFDASNPHPRIVRVNQIELRHSPNAIPLRCSDD